MTIKQLERLGFVHKRLTKHIYLCRVYADKNKHSFLYHVLIPFYVKAGEDE